MYTSTPSSSLPQLCKALTFTPSTLKSHQPNSPFSPKQHKLFKTHVLNTEKIVKIQSLKGSGVKTIKTHVLKNEKIAKIQSLKGSGFKNNEKIVKIEALKGSGFLSAIGNAIEEEEEYRKARAEVNRKSADLGGYSVEGISVGGHETCVIVPELKSAFDIGRCPPKAVHQNFLFITHAHLDHIVSFLLLMCVCVVYSYL